MSDLISRCELFNKLATIPAPPEANALKGEVYSIIQSMPTEERRDMDGVIAILQSLLDAEDIPYAYKLGIQEAIDTISDDKQMPEYAPWKDAYEAMTDCSWK